MRPWRWISLPVAYLVLSASLQALQVNDKIQINGYSSFEFEKQIGRDGKGDPNGSFDADLLDLVLNIQATERLRIASDLTWEHGSATEDGLGNVAVEYAFAEYTLYDWLRVRAGKMFVHFGIYNEIHTAKPAFLTVKEPRSTNKSDKFGSTLRFYPRWGAGLAVAGNGLLGDCDYDYVVQLMNGDQEKTNPYEEDDNKAKALGARIRFHPAYNLRVGFSAYHDTLEQWDEEDPDISLGEADQLSWGAQLEYAIGDFAIELEHVCGTVDADGAPALDAWGVTAMISYSTLSGITPYFRYEFLDPDTDLSDDEASAYIYGCNIMLDQGLFLKLEMNSYVAEENNRYFEGVDYEEFKGAIGISF